MSETYVIAFRVKPERLDRFHALLGPVLDAMRQEEAFIHAALHVHPDHPNLIQLHETWTDRQDVLNVQLHRPYRAQWHAELDDLLEVPRDLEIWHMLRMDR